MADARIPSDFNPRSPRPQSPPRPTSGVRRRERPDYSALTLESRSGDMIARMAGHDAAVLEAHQAAVGRIQTAGVEDRRAIADTEISSNVASTERMRAMYEASSAEVAATGEASAKGMVAMAEASAESDKAFHETMARKHEALHKTLQTGIKAVAGVAKTVTTPVGAALGEAVKSKFSKKDDSKKDPE